MLTEGLFRRFMFMRHSRKRGRLIQRLKQNIDLLIQLNKEEKLMKPISPQPNELEELKLHSRFLKNVHNYCENLYHALSGIWQCNCHQNPSAMLRLENHKHREVPELVRFSLFLTFERCSLINNQDVWGFQETEVCIDQRCVSLASRL